MICAPDLLTQVLPALSSGVHQVRQAGEKVNSSLMAYVASLPDDETEVDRQETANTDTLGAPNMLTVPKGVDGQDRSETTTLASINDHAESLDGKARGTAKGLTAKPSSACCQEPSLDYEGCVTALTMQFLDEHEATRVASLSWLIMLQRKAPRRVGRQNLVCLKEVLTHRIGVVRRNVPSSSQDSLGSLRRCSDSRSSAHLADIPA